MSEKRKTADLPLAVWPCAQKTSQWQRHGRYLPESNRHPAKMLPALARRAIETYSDPGNLVVDPMCGIGTTLVEAADLGRRAIGVELEPRWAKLAVANLDHVHGGGRTRSLAKVIEGDARQLPRLLSTRAGRLLNRERPGKLARIASGAVDLILTSPPYGCEIADVSTENLISGHGPLRRDRYHQLQCQSTQPRARPRRRLPRGDGRDIRACAAVLKPGGYFVCVTKDLRSDGVLRNLSRRDDHALRGRRAAVLAAHNRSARDRPRRRDCDAPVVLADAPRPPPRALGDRTHVVAHEDVLVFRKPARAATAAQTAPVRRAA